METNDRQVADQNLQNQINNIQLIPGPQGPPGTPSWNESRIQALEAKILELEKKVGPYCGNGKVENGEQCDDGNNIDGDRCSAVCQYEFLPPGINSNSIDLNSNLAQSIYISDSQQIGLDITGDMTIEIWVKLKSAPKNNETFWLVSKRTHIGDQRAYGFWYEKNSSDITSLRFEVSSNGIGKIPTIVWVTLNTGIWYHLAVVYDASAGTTDFYINGSQQGTQQFGLDISIFNSSANFQIGSSDFQSPAEYFDGFIDEVKIWNIKRTQTEIQNTMNTELTGTEHGLMGYWKFNGNFLDYSPNGNHLTGVNSPTYSSDTPF